MMNYDHASFFTQSIQENIFFLLVTLCALVNPITLTLNHNPNQTLNQPVAGVAKENLLPQPLFRGRHHHTQNEYFIQKKRRKGKRNM